MFSRSSIDKVGLAVLKKVLFYGTLLITALICFLLFEFAETYKPLRIVAGCIFFIGLFIATFAIPMVIDKMEEDKGLYLREAIKLTFIAYISMASCLPIIGTVFLHLLPSKKQKNPFTEDSD